MSPRSRRHGVPRLAFLGVLVAMLLALGLAGTAAAGAALPAQDVVVNVTAGANDPVSGATVVARDDLTGRVVSNATTTGNLGYTVVRLRPGASTRRLTITATGGRSQAVGRLTTATGGRSQAVGNVMSATAQRGVIAREIEVNVNPGSTVVAEYLDERPRASVAAAERAVARRLRLPAGTDVAESARFSRLRFSGEDFIRAARTRGGLEDYAEWAALRIAGGTALPSFAARVPADDLPYRGVAGQRQNGVTGLVLAPLKPVAAVYGMKLLCAMRIPEFLKFGEFCEDKGKGAPGQLSSADRQLLTNISTDISNLRVQMSGVEATLGNIDVQVGNLGGQVALLGYQAEMNAVDDVVKATAVVAGVRAQGQAVPDDVVRTLRNALVQRLAINAGCPNWAALIGSLPPSAVRDANGPRHPDAACAASAQSVGTQNGLLQFAQRTTAAASRFVAAGPTQGTVDAAGEFWLGEFARNVLSVNLSSAYALQTGTSTRNAGAVDATADLFEDVVEVIDVDATGTYFGARIPDDQVLAMGATQGTIYGIGSYRDPGDCRGGAVRPVRQRYQRWSEQGRSRMNHSYLPSGVDPLDTNWKACSPAQLIQPPASVAGAPATPGWQAVTEVPAAHRQGIRNPLRNAALCRVQEAVVAASTSRRLSALFFNGDGGTICVPGRAAMPAQLGVEWFNSGKKADGVLPNLQVSVNHGTCQPWEIGTSAQTFRDPGGYSDLVTAVGMQCPVIDLTPQAPAENGWNCVFANPAGAVAVWSNRQHGARPDITRVTSSLEALNIPSLGGYCPSWGRTTGQGWPTSGARTFCSPGLGDKDPLAFLGWPDMREFPCRRGEPLQGLINELTTFYEAGPGGLTARVSRFKAQQLRDAGINFEAPNWTSNNAAAGDFAVGPLYTSDAVGAYIPGTSPGGPVAGEAPPRRAVQRVSAVRDLAVECVQPCTGPTGSVRVRWRAPERAGGLPIRRYEVRARVINARQDLPGARCSTRGTECTIRDIDVSADVQFFVHGVTALGDGPLTWATLTVGPGTPVLTPVVGGLAVRWSAPIAQWWARGAGPGTTWGSTATAEPGGRSCTVTGVDATSCTITGLEPREQYTVTVVGTMGYFISNCNRCPAKMETAPSPRSAPGTAGARARPGPPAIEGMEVNPGRVSLRWSRPESDGFSAITGYTATAQPGGATCTTLGALACAIDGLSPGTEYTVSVTATNEVGTGDASPSFRRTTPAVLPGPPLTPLVQVSPGTIEVSWVAPDVDGGSAITGYTATASPGGAQCSTDGATTCTINGVPNGTDYEVTVTATNAVGTGPSSLPAAARTPDLTAPGAPRSVELAALPGRIEVTWSAPKSDGGSAVTGYVATATPGGATCTTTGATLCTITGLDDGTAYRVAVAAINVIGTGAPSDSGEAVTPRRDEGGAAPVVDDLRLQAVAIPGTAESGLPVGAPIPGRVLDITGLALRPRTLVPGLGGRIGYTLSEAADVTITFARVGGRDRASRVVHRIPAGRPGALAGDTFIRVLYSFASARRKKPGAWTLTVEARDAQGGVATKTIPIRVRT
ncbi:MAG: fibronectin type III domain-containing protein [Actinomycetota bacterium]